MRLFLYVMICWIAWGIFSNSVLLIIPIFIVDYFLRHFKKHTDRSQLIVLLILVICVISAMRLEYIRPFKRPPSPRDLWIERVIVDIKQRYGVGDQVYNNLTFLIPNTYMWPQDAEAYSEPLNKYNRALQIVLPQRKTSMLVPLRELIESSSLLIIKLSVIEGTALNISIAGKRRRSQTKLDDNVENIYTPKENELIYVDKIEHPEFYLTEYQGRRRGDKSLARLAFRSDRDEDRNMDGSKMFIFCYDINGHCSATYTDDQKDITVKYSFNYKNIAKWRQIREEVIQKTAELIPEASF